MMTDFSIVIPTYGRPDALHGCLESLTRLKTSGLTFDVVVVDDGSPSSPDEVIETFSDKLDLKFKLISHAGPAAARNVGGRLAGGRYLFFTDDDCCIPTNFLIDALVKIKNHPETVIAGPGICAESSGVFSRTSQTMVDYLISVYNRDGEPARFLTTNNLIIERELFIATGGFDESFPLAAGEDREFSDRLLYNGHNIRYFGDLAVKHAHHMGFLGFCRQQFNYGKGAYHFHSIRSQRNAQRMTLESKRFYLNLVLFPLKRKWRMSTLLEPLLIIWAQVMVLLGFVSEYLHFKK